MPRTMVSIKLTTATYSLNVDSDELLKLSHALNRLVTAHHPDNRGASRECEECEYVLSFVTTINRALNR